MGSRLSDGNYEAGQPSIMERLWPGQLWKIASEQLRNSAGGYVWKVDDMARFRRFLCLGSEGGTYYISEKTLGIENVQCVVNLIKEGRGTEVVQEVLKFSVEGRTAKQDPIILVLAICARQDGDANTKKAAYDALNKVCRIPTHLFTFIEYCQVLSKGHGWGRAHRRAISGWYNHFEDDPKRLAFLVTKYRNRNKWTHKDVFRLCHIKPTSDGVGAVVNYVVKGIDEAKRTFGDKDDDASLKETINFLNAVEQAKTAPWSELRQLITKFGLVREHVPTALLKSEVIWLALLKEMPMTALIRNLGKMSSLGMFWNSSEIVMNVCDRLKDQDLLKAARIHPLNILVALFVYQSGRGHVGKLKWPVIEQLVSALDEAFYLSFKFVEPTNKRYLLALDVSGSMGLSSINGVAGLTPHVASAAMAMTTLRTEKTCDIVGFSSEMVPIPIKKTMDLYTVTKTIRQIPMGATDCSLPMVWAKRNKKIYDVIIIYTDSETYCGWRHPAEALRKYRRASGNLKAKLIVVGMTSNGFTIADPEDPGMLDMTGFDSAAPEIIRNFALDLF